MSARQIRELAARALAQLRVQRLVADFGVPAVARKLRGKRGLELVNDSMVRRWAHGTCQPSYRYARPLLRVLRRLERFEVLRREREQRLAIDRRIN